MGGTDDQDRGLRPTDARGPYAYLTASGTGKVVAHNLMLGGSFFNDWEGKTMEPFVGDVTVGGVAGWKNLMWGSDVQLAYILSGRSNEFKGQGGYHEWGTIRIAVGRTL